MVRVERTCIVNLNITDFYVFSYSATEKTRKGFGELSCYVNLLCFIIIFFSSLLKRDCFSQSFKMQFNIWSKNHTYRAQIARRRKECMHVGECSKTYQATSVNLLHFQLGQVQYVFNLYGFL